MLSLQSIAAPLAIGSAVIAYVAYRRMALGSGGDLHDELTHERDSLRCVAEKLPELIELAKQARLATAESKGLLGSEAMERWLGEVEVDKAEAKFLGSHLPAADMQTTDPSVMELDIRLVEILVLSIRANMVADKYRMSLSADELDSRKHLDQSRRLDQAPPALEPSISLAAHS